MNFYEDFRRLYVLPLKSKMKKQLEQTKSEIEQQLPDHFDDTVDVIATAVDTILAVKMYDPEGIAAAERLISKPVQNFFESVIKLKPAFDKYHSLLEKTKLLDSMKDYTILSHYDFQEVIPQIARTLNQFTMHRWGNVNIDTKVVPKIKETLDAYQGLVSMYGGV